jgi:hypothetical protein
VLRLFGVPGLSIKQFDSSFDPSSALLPNYPEFPDSCLLVKFPILKDISNVLICRTHILFKQISHLHLRQPQGSFIQPYFDLRLAIIALVDFDIVLGAHNASATKFWAVGISVIQSGSLRSLSLVQVRSKYSGDP